MGRLVDMITLDKAESRYSITSHAWCILQGVAVGFTPKTSDTTQAPGCFGMQLYQAWPSELNHSGMGRKCGCH